VGKDGKGRAHRKGGGGRGVASEERAKLNQQGTSTGKGTYESLRGRLFKEKLLERKDKRTGAGNVASCTTLETESPIMAIGEQAGRQQLRVKRAKVC